MAVLVKQDTVLATFCLDSFYPLSHLALTSTWERRRSHYSQFPDEETTAQRIPQGPWVSKSTSVAFARLIPIPASGKHTPFILQQTPAPIPHSQALSLPKICQLPLPPNPPPLPHQGLWPGSISISHAPGRDVWFRDDLG